MREQLDVAMVTLCALAPVTYRLRRPRIGSGEQGPHLPVPCTRLMFEACVNGNTMTAVGMKFGWWVKRQAKPAKRKGLKRSGLPSETVRIVPGRQRIHLAEQLRRLLDEVCEAWDERGFRPLHTFGTVETD